MMINDKREVTVFDRLELVQKVIKLGIPVDCNYQFFTDAKDATFDDYMVHMVCSIT